jgi:hypothetical protein
VPEVLVKANALLERYGAPRGTLADELGVAQSTIDAAEDRKEEHGAYDYLEKEDVGCPRKLSPPERTWGWVKLLNIAELQAICDDPRVDDEIDRTCLRGAKDQLVARVEGWLKRNQERPELRDLCCAPPKAPEVAKKAGTQKKKRNAIEPGTDGAADDRPSLRQRQNNSAAPSRGAAAAAAPAASTRRVLGAPRSRAIVPH